MAEQGISATREEVVGFVTKLRDFHSSLSDSEQAMLESVLDTTRGEVGGYGMYERLWGHRGDLGRPRWVPRGQGGEYTQGFRWMR